MYPVVQLIGVSKSFASGSGAVTAILKTDLTIFSGEFVAIVGPSGSGKSSLMHMIGCLESVSSGRYLLDGVDTKSLDRDALADARSSKLGFVFQGFNLIPRTTALQNVELPLLCARQHRSVAEVRRRAMECLALVGLERWSSHLPNQLSGGQQQRVAIARALANRPSLILADEPTGNLDSASTREVLQILHDLNARGTTIVMVTHDNAVARECSRVISIFDGRLVTDWKRTDDLNFAGKPIGPYTSE